MFLQKKKDSFDGTRLEHKRAEVLKWSQKGAGLLKTKGILMSSLLEQHCPAIPSALQENPGYSMLSLKKGKRQVIIY